MNKTAITDALNKLSSLKYVYDWSGVFIDSVLSYEQITVKKTL